MASLGEAYADQKAALVGRLRSASEGAWNTSVPACPSWSVLDVVKHVTGLAVEAAGGTLPDDLNLLEQFRDPDVVTARDAIADGVVDRRSDVPPGAVLDEWDAAEPALLALFRGEAGAGKALPFAFDAVLVTDLAMHAADVASALGWAPGRDSAAAKVAFGAYAFGVDYRIRQLGLPALGLRYGEKERTLGEGPPGAEVAGDRWELTRMMAGRRSRDQIAALDWTGDPEPYLALLPAYGERAEPLVEQSPGARQ